MLFRNIFQVMTKMRIRERWNSLSNKQKLLAILITGIVIRLVIMPFFGHEDIMLSYGRAYELAFNGANPLSIGQPISHWIESITLFIYSIFFGNGNLLPMTTSVLDNSWLNLNLFVYKIPYLLFDIGSFYLLFQLVKKKSYRFYSLAFYFLNPILIFAVYVFGRYETFPIFFILLTLLLLKMKKVLWSTLSMGLLTLTRSSMLMLIPIYILTVGKTWKQKLSASIISILPFLLTTLYRTYGLGDAGGVNWLVDGQHTNYLLDSKIVINEVLGSEIYLFLVAYVIIAFFAFKAWMDKRNKWKNAAYFMGLTLLAFFSISFYHPQYLAWLVPFIAVLLFNKEIRRYTLLVFSGIVLAYPFMLLSWGQDVLLGVARPLSEWIGSKDLSGLVAHIYDPWKLANLGRSAISALLIILSYFIYEKRK